MRYSKRNRGFTLVEAMIAMVILSAATAAVILPFSTGAALNAEGVRQTVATRLAADRLEEIVNAGYDQIALGYYVSYDASPWLYDAQWQPYTDPIYEKFSRVATCTLADVGEESESVYLVTVSVYYNSAGLDTPTVQLSTLVGR